MVPLNFPPNDGPGNQTLSTHGDASNRVIFIPVVDRDRSSVWKPAHTTALNPKPPHRTHSKMSVCTETFFFPLTTNLNEI